MIGTKPGIFVSSTFFDLREHRQMLKHFIEGELGCTAFLFEDPAFPINPDATTVQNCKDRVEKNADILILIVGARYGYIDKDSAKSVTNIEYLAARAKGVPIYVFVEATVLNYLAIWRDNPNADFSKFVDTPLLFQFVDQIRQVDSVWTREFSKASEVVDTLRTQLAYLFQDALDARRRLRGDVDQWLARTLSGEALRLAIDRPKAWEYRLFAACLRDEVCKRAARRREHKTGIALGFTQYVPVAEYPRWVGNRLHEIERATDQLNLLFERELQQAFGSPGKPGDAREIVFVAAQIGAIYESTIEWAQSVRRHRFNSVFEKAVAAFAHFSDDLIEAVEAFGPRALAEIDAALACEAMDGEKKTVKLTLTMDLSNVDEYRRESRAAFDRIESGDFEPD